MVESSTRRDMDDKFKEKDDNKQAKIKLLFVHGEQFTPADAKAAYTNALALIVFVIKNPTKAMAYKHVYEILELLKSDDGVRLFKRMDDNAHFVHYLICDLQRMLMGLYNSAVRPKWLTYWKAKTDIPFDKSLGIAKRGFEFIKNNLWHAVGGNDGLYAHPPKSWVLFSRRSLNKNYRWDAIENGISNQGTATPAKRQRTSGANSGTQPGTSSNNNPNNRMPDKL